MPQAIAREGATARPPTGHRAETDASHCRAVQRVIVAMRERLDDRFSLNDMADVAIMSPFHFNRTFREVTGVPPCHFLGAVRLETARRLLVTTPLSVTDVCFEVGYNSLGTFTRRFTELLGLSPRRLRLMAGSRSERIEVPPSDARRSTPEPGATLAGRVEAPPGFHEPIFIGLFRTSIPESRPVACALVEGSGRYRIAGVPDGAFHLFATGVRWTGPREYLLYESAVRGGGQPISVREGVVTGSPDLVLRDAAITDPPILVTLPLLLARREAARQRPRAGMAIATVEAVSPP